MMQSQRGHGSAEETTAVPPPPNEIMDLRWTHFDRPLQLRLLVPQPHHADDGQGDAEPVEEAEEVYDGENVVGEGI